MKEYSAPNNTTSISSFEMLNIKSKKERKIEGQAKEQAKRRQQFERGCEPISAVLKGMDSASSSFAELEVPVDWPGCHLPQQDQSVESASIPAEVQN